MDHQRGFAVLLSLLIVAAIGVAICVPLLYLSVNATTGSLALQESAEANGIASACAESALEQLASNSSYTGSGNLTLGQGTCSYSIVVSGATDSIDSTGTVGSTIRKVEIKITTPQLTVSSWQEVADFN